MSSVCNLCGSSRRKYLFTRFDKYFGTQKTYQCKDCGLSCIDPLPGPAKLENHYDKDFFERFDYVQSGIMWEKFYELNLAYIERIKNKGKLLEVGCGLGHFLKIARNRGWEARGVELSEFASSYAIKNFGLNIYTGTLEDAKFCDNQFDAVILWATLEHLVDPLKQLFEISRILKPGGLLAFSVPNHNYLMARLYGMQNHDMLYGGHLYHFPMKTIKLLLDKSGFIGLRRMVIFGGNAKKDWSRDIMQFIARKIGIGSDMRIIAFKK